MAQRSYLMITSCIIACAALLSPLVIRSVNAQDAAASTDVVGEGAPSLALDAFDSQIKPFFLHYCNDCHSGDDPKADLNLEAVNAFSLEKDNHDLWMDIFDVIDFGDMPPEDDGVEQPSAELRQYVVNWIQARFDEQSCDGPLFPGRVTIHRLNRAEYNNTIRDLVGVNFNPAADFPTDDVGAGFDNIADVLSISPILTEKYLNAAEQITERAFTDEAIRNELVTERPSELLSADDAARRVMRRFATRAFRRPLRDGELDRLMLIVGAMREAEADFDTQIKTAMQAVLVSPHFLFRIEQDPAENDEDGIRELDSYEIASRLSYFLWSSMPDEELFELASKGKLADPEVVEQQVRRMIAHPNTQAFVKNFGGQWLNLRNVEAINPDPVRFPEFDESLRVAMVRETEMYFENILREDRSILEFLDADYSFVNERLARHYGIENVTGDEFRRVQLPPERGGVLTQGSILLLTSNPTRTSPVKRGKWILENILADPPKDPPVVEPLNEDEGQELLGSLRERMEQHRANPECAVCHRPMDPLGFGFENFDAVGKWRDMEGRFKVDPSGELPTGETFQGPSGLRKILTETRSGPFAKAVAEKMLTYALGRELKHFDRCTIEHITQDIRDNEYRMSAVILAIVNSEAFTQRARTGEPTQ